MTSYVISSECGLKREFSAKNIEAAKEIYEREFHFDFDGARDGEYPGSWYWIDEDGLRVEDCTESMPR